MLANTDTPGTHTLSVVIPTYNNVDVLRRCLQRWETVGAALGDRLQVVVIEDGCSDGTVSFLQEVGNSAWGKRCLRWVHENDAHELVCTNRGIGEASGSLILTWQDDMLLNHDWFMPELLRTFDAYPDLGLLTLTRGMDCFPFDEPITEWEDLHDVRRMRSTVGPPPLNWFRLQEVDVVIRPWVVRRTCLDAVGVLDEAFRPTEWDEADLCFRIRAAGWKVAAHAYERLGAYTHLGSTTLQFSEAYKAKVLRNGRLFHERWDEVIRASHPRTRRSWPRLLTPITAAATARAFAAHVFRRIRRK